MNLWDRNIGGRRRRLWGSSAALAGILWLTQARAEAPPPLPTSLEPVINGLTPLGVTVGGTTKWMISGRNLRDVERLRISGGGVDAVSQEAAGEGRLAVLVHASATAKPGVRELRVEGPGGLSNLVLFRVDTLEGSEESEPNDRPADATELRLNAAAGGTLGSRDVDHFRIKGRGGQPVTVEVEARRLGSPLAPIVTLLSSTGRALIQRRETPGLEGDCRATSSFPPDGTVVVRVHDALYQGGGGASYWLRVFDGPFATAVYPLGGMRGETIEVTVSGGTLDEPRRRRIELPDRAGGVVALAPFEGPGPPVVVDRRLIVGAAPELIEGRDEPDTASTRRLPQGWTANGWIDKPGEVDCYLVPVRRGERLRAVVQAGSLGSWLDSVLTLRDGQGRRLAENDDPTPGAIAFGPAGPPDRGAFATDSQLVHQAEADGEWRIEVTDRYGDGGAEYAYRLSVEPVRDDFRVEFETPRGGEGQGGLRGPEGVLNLAPGGTRRVPLKVVMSGRSGPIVLRASGLPPGIVAAPVTVRLDRTGARTTAGGTTGPTIRRVELLLEVASDAEPVVGALRVVGTSTIAGGSTRDRAATIALPIHRWGGTPSRRPVVRELDALPIKVLGPARSRQSR